MLLIKGYEGVKRALGFYMPPCAVTSCAVFEIPSEEKNCSASKRVLFSRALLFYSALKSLQLAYSCTVKLEIPTVTS